MTPPQWFTDLMWPILALAFTGIALIVLIGGLALTIGAILEIYADYRSRS
jgi:uncharacterized membrane protein